MWNRKKYDEEIDIRLKQNRQEDPTYPLPHTPHKMKT